MMRSTSLIVLLLLLGQGCRRAPAPVTVPAIRAGGESPANSPTWGETSADTRTHDAGALPRRATAASPPVIAAMVQEIDGKRMLKDVERLAAFGTRHTLSDTTSTTRGIGAARRYIADELASAGSAVPSGAKPRLRVDMDTHRLEPDGKRITKPVDVVNVVATLPGAMPRARHRHYYVIGHYDSRATDVMDPDADAPGANDDASGVAVVLELARVMAQYEWDATLVFMATAGEEQGLLGAKSHARAAAAAHIDIRAVLNNDIVGDPSSPYGAKRDKEIRVFSDGMPEGDLGPETLAAVRKLGLTEDSRSRQLARFVAEIAQLDNSQLQPLLVFRRDRFLRGGDHTAFHEAGFPAIRFCEVDENYDRQHQDPRDEAGRSYGDFPRFVDGSYLAAVARLNAATLGHLANAPSSPTDVRIVTAKLDNDTLLRWSPSPEPDVRGYELVWRSTDSASWQHTKNVGLVESVQVPINKDNFVFGVRAHDEAGYRSPVSVALARPD